MAELPPELKHVLNDLFHQLERLRDPGLRQGGEVHHAHVHLGWSKHASVCRTAYVTHKATNLGGTQEEELSRAWFP